MEVMGTMTTLGPPFSIMSAGVLLGIESWSLLFCVFATLTVILFVLGVIIFGKKEENENPTLNIISVIYISLTLTGLLYGISTLSFFDKIVALITIIIGILLLTF